VAGVLAAGIIVGAALGPGPTSSPADGSTLAQRALAALVAEARSSQPSTPTSSTAAPQGSGTTTRAAHATAGKAGGQQADSDQAAVPPSTESAPSQESSSEAPSGEGSSEGTKGTSESKTSAPGTPIKLPPIKHVWVIALSGMSLSAALANPTTDPYLARQLAPKGTLLGGYTLSASSELGNGIALLSGQGVNLDTEQNCPSYLEVQPPTINAASGLAEGVGCVYPAAVKTLPDELTAAGLTWKAYVQGMQPGSTDPPTAPAGPGAPGAAPSVASAVTPPQAPTSTSTQTAAPTPTATPAPTPTPTATVTCRHPEPGAADPSHAPVPGDPYLTFDNPFVYFHSLLDGGACASGDVDLGALQGDLATPASTPSFSWIAPSACDDGSSAPCAPGAPAGLAPVDAFLKEAVGQILASAAYREGGLIAILPNSAPSPVSASKPVGALLLSPFVHSGAHLSESLNDFSLLKSLTRLFGVLPLGHANDPSAVSFGTTVYGTSGKAASAASTAKKAAQAAAAQPRRRPASHAGG
jgi:hypothetical protein